VAERHLEEITDPQNLRILALKVWELKPLRVFWSSPAVWCCGLHPRCVPTTAVRVPWVPEGSLAGVVVRCHLALELACGLDFSRRLMCGAGPGDLGGPRGSALAENKKTARKSSARLPSGTQSIDLPCLPSGTAAAKRRRAMKREPSRSRSPARSSGRVKTENHDDQGPLALEQGKAASDSKGSKCKTASSGKGKAASAVKAASQGKANDSEEGKGTATSDCKGKATSDGKGKAGKVKDEAGEGKGKDGKGKVGKGKDEAGKGKDGKGKVGKGKKSEYEEEYREMLLSEYEEEYLERSRMWRRMSRSETLHLLHRRLSNVRSAFISAGLIFDEAVRDLDRLESELQWNPDVDLSPSTVERWA